jgi:cell division septation protein DedD
MWIVKMEKITRHIIALFYEHDCVVLPRLGGFLANYRPAFHDVSNNVLVPPRKEFLFNRHLLHNDGLLAHKISTEEGMSYQDAVMLMDAFVSEVMSALKQQRQFTIQGIGVVYYDKDEVIRLKNESANYLLGSFGLPVVKCLPVIQRPAITEETPVIDLGVANENTKEKEDKVVSIQRSSRAKWWVAAALLPIGFYSAWIPMKTSLFKGNGEFHFSELNPFAFVKVNSVYTPLSSNELTIDSLYISLAPVSTEENLVAEPNTEDWVMEDIAEEPVITPTAPLVITSGEFHVIGGCFSKSENADKFVSDMLSQGMDAYIIDQNGGLYRVALASFDSQEMAKEFSITLKSKDISTWILKKQL